MVRGFEERPQRITKQPPPKDVSTSQHRPKPPPTLCRSPSSASIMAQPSSALARASGVRGRPLVVVAVTVTTMMVAARVWCVFSGCRVSVYCLHNTNPTTN